MDRAPANAANTARPLRVVRAAVDRDAVAALVAAVDARPLSFTGGRQGGGYQKATLDDLVDVVGIGGPLQQLAALLGAPLAVDRYWLVYPMGSSIAAHTDPSPADGLVHLRANLVVDVAEGGAFEADGAIIELGIGDAVVFRPDLVVHQVTRVTRGTRRVLSVGTIVSAEAAAAVLSRLPGLDWMRGEPDDAVLCAIRRARIASS
jgi:hypothetical protein